jgi:hypothetical protein
MKENTDVRYMKVWRRNEKQEEKVNEHHVPKIIVTIFIATQDHNEFTGQEEGVKIHAKDEDEDVRIQKDDERNAIIQEEDEKEDVSIDEEEYYFASE